MAHREYIYIGFLVCSDFWLYFTSVVLPVDLHEARSSREHVILVTVNVRGLHWKLSIRAGMHYLPHETGTRERVRGGFAGTWRAVTIAPPFNITTCLLIRRSLCSCFARLHFVIAPCMITNGGADENTGAGENMSTGFHGHPFGLVDTLCVSVSLQWWITSVSAGRAMRWQWMGKVLIYVCMFMCVSFLMDYECVGRKSDNSEWGQSVHVRVYVCLLASPSSEHVCSLFAPLVPSHPPALNILFFSLSTLSHARGPTPIIRTPCDL